MALAARNAKTRVRLTICVLALAAGVLATRVQGQAQAQAGIERINGIEAFAGEVLVKLRTAPQAAAGGPIENAADAASIRSIGRTGLLRVRSRSLDTATLVARLANRPDVLYAEPNYIIHAFTEPNDPSFPELWGLKNLGQSVNGGVAGIAGADIHAASAWDVSVGSASHVVAVVDTGIDYTHPDLAPNMWSAPSSFVVTIAGNTITCPAGSHGFNTILMTCDPLDDHFHGTHVSGTIGAAGGNGFGVVGVNWIARLMGVKFLDANGSGSVADAVNGIDFVMQAKQAFARTSGADVRVLSNSWGGGGFSQALLDEIRAAGAADMLFVAAAGNNGASNDSRPTYPASYAAATLIAVAATDNLDTLAWFSNYGKTSVHLAAPGVDILSTVLGGGYEFHSGTSMATPHVSGAAALVLSRCALGTAALKDTLLATIEPVPALTATTITGGRLDVNSAIRSCVAPPDAATELTAMPGDSQVTLQWSGATGGIRFTVKRAVASGGPYDIVAAGVKSKSFVDTTAVNDTTYFYVVSASNDLGVSGDSNEASATPKAKSDLIVSSLAVPTAAGANTSIAASVTTKNQGPGRSLATTTRLYLAHSPVLDASATALDGAQAVAPLTAGSTATATVSVSIPNVAAGVYYLIAKADADGVEAETIESNNTLARNLSIGPDLVVSLTAPTTAVAGGTIVVSDAVRNQGAGAAAATTTRFYLSTNALSDAGDVLFAESRAVPPLDPGASSAGTTTLQIPASVTTGSYFLIAKADADNAVAETLELNNTAFKLVQVGGDLVVSAFTVPPRSGSGATIVVTDTVKNQGGGAVGPSVTRYYLSANISLDASDTLLAASRLVPALDAGAANTGSTTLTLPAGLSVATYFVIAVADGNNAVLESQETNNSASRAIAIGPDLIVSAFSAPFSAAAGSTVTVSDTVLNQGGDPAAASVIRFYWSANVLFDASDQPIAARSVPALGPNVSNSGATGITIPAGTAPGIYYIIAFADADGTVAESGETNNTRAAIVQVK